MKWLILICSGAFALQAAPVTTLQFSRDGKQLLINRPRAIEVRVVKGDGEVLARFEPMVTPEEIGEQLGTLL